MMTVFGRARVLAGPLLLAAVCALPAPEAVLAQSLTSGSLRGQVNDESGVPLSGVAVTLEAAQGGLRLELETDFDGAFSVPLLAPGIYDILAEQIGFQPVRRIGITVTAGQRTTVVFALERRPPPISAPTEIQGDAARTGMGRIRTLTDFEMRELDRNPVATDALRGTSAFVSSFDDRQGIGVAGSGLPAMRSRLLVDGIPEVLLRHPGLPAEPLQAEGFARQATEQLNVLGTSMDNEFRGTPGTLLSALTRRGGNTVSFQPYGWASSAKIGDRTELNPGDSSGTSFLVGAVLSGAIVPDTAHFLIQAQYQSIELPTAEPWTPDPNQVFPAVVGGGSLAEQIRTIGQSFGRNLAAETSPVVRTWEGGSALARVDWRLSGTQELMVRVGGADWEEESPRLGNGLANNARTKLEAQDISAAFGLTSTGSSTANEFRVGFSSADRDWTGSTLPGTVITGSSVAFGTAGELPGSFKERAFDISDAFQVRAGKHVIKFGGNARLTNYEQDYRFGSAGVFTFGDLDRFGAGTGTFFQASGPARPVDFNSTEVGVFLQDLWQATPEIQLLYGVRYETQFLPTRTVLDNTAWQALTGIATGGRPKDRKGFSPHAALVWDVQNRGEWILRAGGGLEVGRLDPAVFAEAMTMDGTVTIRRGLGSFSNWPNLPAASQTQVSAPGLTFLPDSLYRAPKSFKLEAGLTRHVEGGFNITFGGRYVHTDYLLRREDLNRSAFPLATTSEGRPVFGSLVQQGSLITPQPGSNRRFGSFDAVYALLPSGESDYYEFNAAIERQVSRHLSIMVNYTFSDTEDNVLGLSSGDPADQLSPFPGRLNGIDWAEGRSDFDVPHRAAATLRYRSTGRTAVTVAVRGRVQSGLPFTPGFQPGVDLNGDGSGNNDPAFIDLSNAGLRSLLDDNRCDLVNGFAERNSCRSDTQYGVDLSFGIGLPVSAAGRHLTLTVDAYNVTSSESGPVDRALFLVDPAGTLSPPGSRTVNLSLVPNPRFGSILSRRDDPRLFRVGLRIN